jgi:hypothetical protein
LRKTKRSNGTDLLIMGRKHEGRRCRVRGEEKGEDAKKRKDNNDGADGNEGKKRKKNKDEKRRFLLAKFPEDAPNFHRQEPTKKKTKPKPPKPTTHHNTSTRIFFPSHRF